MNYITKLITASTYLCKAVRYHAWANFRDKNYPNIKIQVRGNRLRINNCEDSTMQTQINTEQAGPNLNFTMPYYELNKLYNILKMTPDQPIIILITEVDVFGSYYAEFKLNNLDFRVPLLDATRKDGVEEFDV